MFAKINHVAIVSQQYALLANFYQSVFGGNLEITTVGDLRGSTDAAQDTLIAHATLRGATGVVLMASGRTPDDDGAGGSSSITLGGDQAELTAY